MTRKQTSFHSQISNSLMMFGWSWISQLWWKSYQDSEELDLVLESEVVLDPLLLYCFDSIFDLYSILILAMIIVSNGKFLWCLLVFLCSARYTTPKPPLASFSMKWYYSLMFPLNESMNHPPPPPWTTTPLPDKFDEDIEFPLREEWTLWAPSILLEIIINT